MPIRAIVAVRHCVAIERVRNKNNGGITLSFSFSCLMMKERKNE